MDHILSFYTTGLYTTCSFYLNHIPSFPYSFLALLPLPLGNLDLVPSRGVHCPSFCLPTWPWDACSSSVLGQRLHRDRTMAVMCIFTPAPNTGPGSERTLGNMYDLHRDPPNPCKKHGSYSFTAWFKLAVGSWHNSVISSCVDG